MKEFKRCDPHTLPDNVFDAIGNQWMLITAGDDTACNTMTASWGGLGVMWNAPSAFVFVRPERYTYRFIEQEETFSLCFFDESYRAALKLCGTQSGRDGDKIAAAGLTVRHDAAAPFFDEARLVLICRKRYAQDLSEACITDESVKQYYENGGYHRMYVGEITDVLCAE